MIEPENMPFDDQQGEEAVNNLRENENAGEGRADTVEVNPSNLDRLDQATAASEASFTLEPEKGIPPSAASLNSEEKKDSHDLKS